MLKRFFLLIIVLSFNTIQSQTHLKINGVTAFALIPNIGLETTLKNHLSFQADISASFWKSINGGPLEFVIITPEIRYHVNKDNQGLYLGGHIAGSTFKLQKWNYAETQYYQQGFNYMIGATVGYQKNISKKFLLDVFIGGGNQQAFYKGYYLNVEGRYEKAHDFNKSGEWLPYRGGIMFCYTIN